MSKSIIIDEAGLPKALTVDALRTSKQGGGTEDWAPADGKNLVELDIGGSGTYRASDYGAYGISVARVTPKYDAAATSGSNSENGCVLYGTFDDASGGSVVYADYTAGTQITTDNPGSGNKSSFIIWLKPVD